MAYVPLDAAKRNEGVHLLAIVNLVGLGVEIFVDKFYDDCYIIKKISRGARAGLSTFILLNYQLFGEFVPDNLRANIEPVILKISSPWVSLPASMAMATAGVNSIQSIEDAKNVLQASLRASQEKVLSLKKAEQVLKASLEVSRSKIETFGVTKEYLEKLISDVQARAEVAENFNKEIGNSYIGSRELLINLLQRPEFECIHSILESLKEGNPLRGVKDLNSSVFSSKENEFLIEAPISKLFVRNCKEIYERSQMPVFGDENYQRKIFEKLVQIHNHFGQHTVEKVYEPSSWLLDARYFAEKTNCTGFQILYFF